MRVDRPRVLALAVATLASCVGTSELTRGTHPDGEGEGEGVDATATEVDGPLAMPDAEIGECPNGEAMFAKASGLSDEQELLDLAVDRAGNVALAAGSAVFVDGMSGVVGLSPSGDVRFTLPIGSVVAVDPAGNLYVAGSFTEPIDLGSGVIQPLGTVDVFVAKLDSSGRAVFAKALGRCRDGVASLAVDAMGRIAISGPTFGTTVLLPGGDLQFELAFGGDVAFDSRGFLAVVGAFETIDLGDGIVTAYPDPDVFVIEVDTDGCRLFSHVLPGTGWLSTATSIAIGPEDEIAFVGYTTGSIELFGTTVSAREAGENGRVAGAYAVKLDASGAPIFVRDLLFVEANGVAIDATGRIAISGARTGGTGFLRRLVLEMLDPAGGLLRDVEEYVASGYGRGYAVGFDACGSIYTSLIALDTPSRWSPLRAYVAKLAP